MSAPSRPATPADPTVPAGAAVPAGVVAVAAAVGAGQLVAGLVSPASAPLQAVADAVIRHSPVWLTEFGKSLGPETDKLVLQVGVAVVLVAAGVAAGLLARRTRGPGVAVVVGLGVLGLLAVVDAPTFAPLDLLAPAAALVAGVAAFRMLHRLALAAVDEHAAGGGVARRDVLRGVLAALGVAAVGAWFGGRALGSGVTDSRAQVTQLLTRAPVRRLPPVPAGAAFPESGTPSFLTPNPDFYRIDVALRVPSVDPATWSLRVHGMVDRELNLSFAQLLSRPLVERDVTLTCVSNPVGGDLISTARFVGVELRDLLLEAGVHPDADQIFSRSVDGWYTGTPTDVLLEPGRGALLAVGMNGEALPAEHGFPVRMVVPGLYGYVSATKWLVDLEATTFAAQSGYWLERGWAQRGPIKTEARIDAPGPSASVTAGAVRVAGIAWAQHVGISAVEVRVDGGPWEQAELATDVGPDTWRMWRHDVQVGPGDHVVQARATDAHGVVQTGQEADVVPDGATGWPTATFTAR